MFEAPNFHSVRLGEPDEVHDVIATHHIALSDGHDVGKTGRGALVGCPQNIKQTLIHGTAHLALSSHPGEGKSRAVWLSAEHAPALVRGRLLSHGSIVLEDGANIVRRRSVREHTHVVYIITGIPRPMNFDRGLALDHFLAHNGVVVPHGSVALERDVTLVENYSAPMPVLVDAYQDEETLDNGITIPFERHEVWTISEGCTLLSASLSPLTRKPITRRIRVERNRLVVRPGSARDYDMFLATKGISLVRHAA